MDPQELQKHINKEIAACQLAGGEYRFKCLVCGKNHKVSPRKTIERCFSKLERRRYRKSPYAPYVEKIRFYRDESKASIHFAQIVINIVLPGISLNALYNKTDILIDFLKDFFVSVQNEDEHIKINNNIIRFTYHSNLTEQNPCYC